MKGRPGTGHESSRQIRRGALMSYAAMAFNILAGLIYTPWMIRQIGQADYGLFALAISFISLFTLDFGLGPAVSRFLTRARAEGDRRREQVLLGMIFKLFSALGATLLVALLVVFLLIENIFLELTPAEIEKFRVVFVIAGLYTVVGFPFKPFDGILVANERFAFKKGVALLHRVLVVGVMVAALLLGRGLYALVAVNAGVGLLDIALKWVYIGRKTDTRVDLAARDRKLLKGVFVFSAWTTVISLAQRLILNITPTILGALAGSAQIAIFSVGRVIEGYTWGISAALGGLFLPRVTRMTVARDDPGEVETLMIRVGRLELLVIGIVLLGIVIMGREFMLLWMGQDFLGSYYVAVLLTATGFVSLTQGIAGTMLVAVNEIRFRAFQRVSVATVSLSLSLILARRWGAVGSAAAICTGNMLGVVAMNIVYRKVLKLNVSRFFRECHLKMLPALGLAAMVAVAMQRLFPAANMGFFALKAGALALVYFGLMWALALNKYEKDLLAGVLRPLTRRLRGG